MKVAVSSGYLSNTSCRIISAATFNHSKLTGDVQGRGQEDKLINAIHMITEE